MKIALAQILSSSSPTENLEIVAERAREAQAAGAELVIFPEAVMTAFDNNLNAVAEPLDGPWAERVREIAREVGIAVVVGMFTPGDGQRIRNTLLATGNGLEASYDKIHLFDAFGFRESDAVAPGETPTTFAYGGLTFGLATCYDVRFPALFSANARAGAQVQIVCASWGDGPGKARQWDLLTTARALDSTSYVLACGQADPASRGIVVSDATPLGIGRSAAIDPKGEVIERLDGAEGLLIVDVDAAQVEAARAAIPVLANARLG
ncbi:carbon-nitrogen hydrolase family protein [Zhihengliuella halotolerans]|uniref:Putative amidohydrolase n=1 Tax=Zhihengliuella halotolerans TaxID=370736 RepID=A0A4Q8AGA0_9MICC|nr:carbon-nitrogen hydrolase family protein [Zhihengliuella halotolerans]RZU62871.1 putative amidohydrolase [Zhihengliuella halotolerans]